MDEKPSGNKEKKKKIHIPSRLYSSSNKSIRSGTKYKEERKNYIK
jgi:hypothetical protein